MNILVTICQSTVHKKLQKMAFFRPRDTFMIITPCFLGSKFEYYLTNPRFSECFIANDARGIG